VHINKNISVNVPVSQEAIFHLVKLVWHLNRGRWGPEAARQNGARFPTTLGSSSSGGHLERVHPPTLLHFCLAKQTKAILRVVLGFVTKVRGHRNKPSPSGYAARLHTNPRDEAGSSPATMPDAMVARRGVLVRALILDSTRNSSPSSAMA